VHEICLALLAWGTDIDMGHNACGNIVITCALALLYVAGRLSWAHAQESLPAGYISTAESFEGSEGSFTW
jgi:hypothetical protein